MDMLELSESNLSSIIEALGEAFSDSLKWEWDDRFSGVLAAFEVTEKDRIFAVLNSRFGQAWDSTNISNAPDSVSSVIQDFGGLAANQLLFTSDWNHDVFLLGFWWPWGNGTTISIRFVPYGSEISDSVKEKVQNDLKEAFGI